MVETVLGPLTRGRAALAGAGTGGGSEYWLVCYSWCSPPVPTRGRAPAQRTYGAAFGSVFEFAGPPSPTVNGTSLRAQPDPCCTLRRGRRRPGSRGAQKRARQTRLARVLTGPDNARRLAQVPTSDPWVSIPRRADNPSAWLGSPRLQTVCGMERHPCCTAASASCVVSSTVPLMGISAPCSPAANGSSASNCD